MNLSYYEHYTHDMSDANDYLNEFLTSFSGGEFIKLEKGTTCYMLKISDSSDVTASYNDDGTVYDINIKGEGLKIEYDTTLSTVLELKYGKFTVENIVTSNTVIDGDDYIISETDGQEMIDIVSSLKLR